MTTPHIAADVFIGGEMGGAMKPPSKHDVRRQPAGFAGEIRENGLGYILGDVFTSGLTPGGCVNDVEMASDEFTKRRLVAVSAVFTEQFKVGFHRCFTIEHPPMKISDTGK